MRSGSREREEEIKTLNFAFVNQNYPPKQVLKTIQEYQESDGNKEENKRAEERTESIDVPYIKVYQRNSAEIWVKKILMLYLNEAKLSIQLFSMENSKRRMAEKRI